MHGHGDAWTQDRRAALPLNDNRVAQVITLTRISVEMVKYHTHTKQSVLPPEGAR